MFKYSGVACFSTVGKHVLLQWGSMFKYSGEACLSTVVLTLDLYITVQIGSPD